MAEQRVVRLPDDLWGTAKVIAATQGKKPAEMLREAWEEYVDGLRKSGELQALVDRVVKADG